MIYGLPFTKLSYSDEGGEYILVVRQGFIRSVVIFSVSVTLLGIPAILAYWLVHTAQNLPIGMTSVDYGAHILPPNDADAPLPQRLAELGREHPLSEGPIPRVFMTRLPKSLTEMENAREKKRVFTLTMLPLILRANELILQDRTRAKELQSSLLQGRSLATADAAWLRDIFETYRIEGEPSQAAMNKLLYRMDVIPPSLTLAQAAMESGWGTSYFSQKGNALFGEWVWGDEKGILPRSRDEGKTHRIKSFDYLLDSIRSYMVNLNRHKAYRDLRARRAELRHHNLPVNGSALAPALVDYSERGADYVGDILSIISFNRLEGLDSLTLAEHS